MNVRFSPRQRIAVAYPVFPYANQYHHQCHRYENPIDSVLTLDLHADETMWWHVVVAVRTVGGLIPIEKWNAVDKERVRFTIHWLLLHVGMGGDVPVDLPLALSVRRRATPTERALVAKMLVVSRFLLAKATEVMEVAQPFKSRCNRQIYS